MSRSPRSVVLFLVAALTLAAPACGTSGSDIAKGDSREVPAHSTATTAAAGSDAGSSQQVPPSSDSSGGSKGHATTATTQPAAKSLPDPACRPGPGKTVKDLPDLKIDAVHVAAFDSPDQTIGDTVVPGVHIPAMDLPAQEVEGGCQIAYDAPGGCLGAVEITSASIPGRSVPGASLAPVVIDGRTVFGGDHADGDSAKGDTGNGDRAEQECRVESSDGNKSAVSRAAVSRGAMSRAALSRSAMSRPSICVEGADGNECTDAVYVDAVYVDAAYVDAVYVDAEYIDAEHLPDAPDTNVLTGQAGKAYVTPAAVLFDFDQANLKPAAVPTLRAIADQIATLPAGSNIQVDGHTDDKGSDAYNNDLSTKRAEAVATWLKTDGGVPAERVATKGYGESVPVAPNDTEENRAMNRRVVITVTNQ